MKKAEIIKKKISYSILYFLFGFGLGIIFLHGIIYFQESEMKSNNISSVKTEASALSSNDPKEGCVDISDLQNEENEENEALFVGCNGFF